ncbi:MAG: glycosyltransferase family 2 protein [SAR324 cluster bacterium]|nr:glycosyltransferase family 2 protein [SAR324 cluster bacterium]
MTAIKIPEICAIVVTWNPSVDIDNNLKQLLDVCRHVIIVDNGSQDAYWKTIEHLGSNPQITIIKNATNTGIAGALNQGISKAMEQGYQWGLTMDQDSLITHECVHALSSCLSCGEPDKIAIITPVYRDPATQRLICSKNCNSETAYVEIIANMTSGNLVRLAAIQQVGMFRKDLFIDYVDYEICLRLRKQGYKIIQACQAVMDHQLGQTTRVAIVGQDFFPTNHSPLRRYYIARNRLVLYKNYWKDEPLFLIKDGIRFLGELMKIIFFEQNKSEKIAKTLKGIHHGICGKMGIYEP